MKEIIVKRLGALLSVKSLVTLLLSGVFAYLAITGQTSQEFMTVYTVVIAFYFGTQTQKIIDDGAREIIAVMNTGRLVSEKFEYAEQDLKTVALTAFRKGIPIFVAFDSCFLNDRFFKIACRIADNIGAQGIITATGYGSSGTKPEEIVKIKEMLGTKVKCIANGGIRTLEQVDELVAAGADRVITAFSAQILEEAAIRSSASELITF